METININREICTRCGRCVKVCPAVIFKQEKIGEVVEIVNPETCIICGHCAAACPVGAVEHSSFPKGTIHPIDYSQMPTPEQMMLLCKARRSNRAFSTKPIPEESLRMILEAANRAPTASNLQQIGFTVVTDKEMLSQISMFTINTFNSVLKKVTNPIVKPIIRSLMPDVLRYIPAFERLRSEYAKGNDGILRNATAAIIIHAPKKSRFGIEDANLAYQNGSLMAESLGVSQFYMGFVLSAVKQDKKGTLEKLLGIDGKICAAMALGMPMFRYPNYMDKKDIEVDYI